MSQPPIPTPFESLRSTNLGGAVDPWAFYVAEGAALVALGVVAMIVPALSSLVIEMFVGWLFLVGGCFRIAAVYKRRHTPGFWWSMISAIVAVLLGGMLIAFPVSGMLTLTLALMIMFIVEGVMSLLTALDFRKRAQNWVLLLISGLIDLVLAYMIFQAWPGSGIWFVGLLVGVYMVFTGMSLAFTAMAARSALSGEETKEQASGAQSSGTQASGTQEPSGDLPKGAAPTA